jgi:hypothetical protein
MILLSPYRGFQGYYLELSHDGFLLHPSQLITSLPFFRRRKERLTEEITRLCVSVLSRISVLIHMTDINKTS